MDACFQDLENGANDFPDIWGRYLHTSENIGKEQQAIRFQARKLNSFHHTYYVKRVEKKYIEGSVQRKSYSFAKQIAMIF